MEKEKGRILVVDDNEMNRDLLNKRLTKQGHQVVLAEDGIPALQRLNEAEFDLVLLDVMMPNMNGYEALAAIKGSDALKHIPVLMISALTEVDSVVKCIELGAEDYLPKPFNTILLTARVNACLEKKRWRDKEKVYLEQLSREQQRTEALLKIILPEPVVEELKETNRVVPRRYENVVVIFCDVVSFTRYCDAHSPEEVVCHLQELIEGYEGLSVKHNIQKIKTIGDAYMATAGLLTASENSVLQACKCALEMVSLAETLPCGWKVRVGMHVGPVLAGIVGHSQYLYDVWGDTVNTAARVQTSANPGSVSLSRACWDQVAHCAKGSPYTEELRGKGELELYRLESIQSDPSYALST